MNNSLSPNESNLADLYQQKSESQTLNNAPTDNNQEEKREDLSSPATNENEILNFNNKSLEEEVKNESKPNTNLKRAEEISGMLPIEKIENQINKPDGRDIKIDLEKQQNVINNKEEESQTENEDQFHSEKEEEREERASNELFAEEEEFSIENDNQDVVFDSDIEYSIDSEDELIEEIFDENRPTIIVKRNYQDEFDKRSVRSLKSIKSSRSTRSIKKRHISKIQRYNVTRPFLKTEHFDTKPNPNEEEFKEEHDPIRYSGSRGFLKRQSKSNNHRVELRSQEPTERGFDPPLFQKKEKRKYPNKPYDWWKPKSEVEGYVPNTPANSYLEDLFRQSVKKAPVIIEEPLPKMYKVNRTSNMIAKQKNKELIDVIAGNEKIIPEVKFVSIMKRFNISNIPEPEEPYAPRPLICKIKDAVKIDNKYDNVKLKELLINAMTGGNMDDLSSELRPPVLAAFSNIRPSYIIPRKSSKGQNSKTQSPKEKSDNSINTSKRTSTENQYQNRDIKEKSKFSGNRNQKEIKNSQETQPTSSKEENKKIENRINDDDDYSIEDEVFVKEPKKYTKAKTPQKRSSLASDSRNQVQDPKAKTVKSQKQKSPQTPESDEKDEPHKRRHRHKNSKNIENDEQSVKDMGNDYKDSNESVEIDKKAQKKSVRPKQPTHRGGKYFPGFYDNLDFFVNKSPHKH